MEGGSSDSVGTRALTAAYAALIGVVYVAAGLLEMMNGLGIGQLATIPSDVFGGLMLIFIGGIFLRSVGELRQGRAGGMSYLLVGALMTVIYSVLYILILSANGVEYLLGSEEFLEWTWLDDFRLEIWLPLIAVPAIALLHSRIRSIRADNRG